jgi:hypothetical protein
VTFFNHFNHCCISSAAAQKQSTCKCQRMDFRVARVAQRSMIRTKQRMYISTHTPYTLQRAHAHTHTHHIFCRKREHTHTHTHRNHQSQIHHVKCVRLTVFNHCCVSSAAAQNMQKSGHGLTSCAAIDESRKEEYAHRQYSLQNTLHRNCNLCNER